MRNGSAPYLVFRQADGQIETSSAEPGQSLLEAARVAGIANIGGFCGGIGACVRCMVRIDPAWIDQVGPPAATEAGMLRLGGDPGAGVRLACQVRLAPALSGLTVHVLPPVD